MKETTETYILDITESTDIAYDEIVIDNSLENNKVKVEVTYYVFEEYQHKIAMEKYEHCDVEMCNDYIGFYPEYEWKEFNVKKFIDSNFITYLKEKKIYDYSRINDYTVKIYMNETTKDLVNN